MEHRRIGKSAIYVSDICMGTMTFGTFADEKTSFAILDRCYEAGVSLAYTGLELGSIFRQDHVEGAYRKKYLRCLSRLAAMCSR